jgi:hypothetical protein
MADKDLIVGHVINVMGMVGVLSGILLFTFAMVLLLFRHGFGFVFQTRSTGSKIGLKSWGKTSPPHA